MANATCQFTQGAIVGGNGQSVVGFVVSSVVTMTDAGGNAANTTWQWTIISWPGPLSGPPPITNATTRVATVTPTLDGVYIVRLTRVENTVTTIDIKFFGVIDADGLILPSAGQTGAMTNVGGSPLLAQAAGWMGRLDASTDLFVDAYLRFLKAHKYSAGGDLAGSGSVATVTAIQGIPVKSGTPSDGQVLTFVLANNRWEPQTISGGSGKWSIGGDSIPSDSDFGALTDFVVNMKQNGITRISLDSSTSADPGGITIASDPTLHGPINVTADGDLNMQSTTGNGSLQAIAGNMTIDSANQMRVGSTSTFCRFGNTSNGSTQLDGNGISLTAIGSAINLLAIDPSNGFVQIESDSNQPIILVGGSSVTTNLNGAGFNKGRWVATQCLTNAADQYIPLGGASATSLTELPGSVQDTPGDVSQIAVSYVGSSSNTTQTLSFRVQKSTNGGAYADVSGLTITGVPTTAGRHVFAVPGLFGIPLTPQPHLASDSYVVLVKPSAPLGAVCTNIMVSVS